MVAVNYLWNPINDNIVREFDDSGNTIAEYTTEPDLYGNVVSQFRNGQTSYLLSDAQGNTTEPTNDVGNVTDTIRYSSFGEVTQRTGTTEIPFQYAGQKGYYVNAEVADYDVRRRRLLPAHARWLSVDSKRFSDGINVYCMVRNSPAVSIDPSGNLTVIPLTTDPIFDDPDCGDKGEVTYDFRLDKHKHCAGYLIQKIILRCNYDPTCKKCPNASPHTPTAVFYEAWFVDEDSSLTIGRSSVPPTKATDTRSIHAPSWTCGLYSSLGEVRFFCVDKTGDIGGPGTNPKDPKSPWKIGRKYGTNCGVEVKDQPSTDQKPIFWDDPDEVGNSRTNVSCFWCCCRFTGYFVDVIAEPRN